MKQCTCGSTKFTAHQICRHDIMVDGDNNFLMDVGIYDSETPYEPYHCARCNKEYKDLADLPEVDDTAAVPQESIGSASDVEAEQRDPGRGK